MRWLKVWLIIGLLLGSIVPAGMALADEAGTAPLPPEIQDNSTTETQVVAEHIVSALERLHNVTSTIIEKANVSENSTVFEHYQKAEEYREAAIQDYQNGNYEGAIANGILAMRHYKVILEKVKNVRNDVGERLQEELRRMQGYFMAAEKTIRKAQEEGIDVGDAPQLLNQTKEAYRQVMEDIKNKDIEKAKEDLAVARELKKGLDEKLVEIRKELAYANADKIVNAFLRRGENAMKFAQRVIEKANASGRNVTELQEMLEEFQAVYEQVKELADQGNYTEALDVITANKETIGKFHKAIELTKRKIHEVEVKEKIKNMAKLIGELNERIGKDARALAEPHRKGVDTRTAQLKLKTAAQEVRLSAELLKRGKKAEAKAHLLIALDLLEDVESFIVKHA
ncbi:hypothetical protein, conserved [Thermococcus kodakarensis KOD1]|uniref:DNA double-strand break repair Rad50 ATPase n=1 Tax=Thermococcus kodakarensis (strain ATCC BAA-918 / JCM 12380 / KOD1) TaxID=69014 RepID=Q5JH38_THEKO|nr:hypothetical protein [Thermococcus kodakarensis]WCN27428.1 hypothetical protein POG15_07420 [Thermococcus kodakarensis]WCN29718.1 hypothetical protein POG21_07415 [Thermococcus kodakarensis]BAD85648.1 hypothetical protein, conserved [Thermococcus kodakarensis KOD1]